MAGQRGVEVVAVAVLDHRAVRSECVDGDAVAVGFAGLDGVLEHQRRGRAGRGVIGRRTGRGTDGDVQGGGAAAGVHRDGLVQRHGEAQHVAGLVAAVGHRHVAGQFGQGGVHQYAGQAGQMSGKAQDGVVAGGVPDGVAVQRDAGDGDAVGVAVADLYRIAVGDGGAGLRLVVSLAGDTADVQGQGRASAGDRHRIIEGDGEVQNLADAVGAVRRHREVARYRRGNAVHHQVLVVAQRTGGARAGQGQHGILAAAALDGAASRGQRRGAGEIEVGRHIAGPDDVGEVQGGRAGAAGIGGGAAAGERQGRRAGDGDVLAETHLDRDDVADLVGAVGGGGGDARDLGCGGCADRDAGRVAGRGEGAAAAGTRGIDLGALLAGGGAGLVPGPVGDAGGGAAGAVGHEAYMVAGAQQQGACNRHAADVGPGAAVQAVLPGTVAGIQSGDGNACQRAGIHVCDAGADDAGNGLAGVVGVDVVQAGQGGRGGRQYRCVVDAADRHAGLRGAGGEGAGAAVDGAVGGFPCGVRRCAAAGRIPGAEGQRGGFAVGAVGHIAHLCAGRQQQRGTVGHAAHAVPGHAVGGVLPGAVAGAGGDGDAGHGDAVRVAGAQAGEDGGYQGAGAGGVLVGAGQAEGAAGECRRVVYRHHGDGAGDRQAGGIAPAVGGAAAVGNAGQGHHAAGRARCLAVVAVAHAVDEGLGVCRAQAARLAQGDGGGAAAHTDHVADGVSTRGGAAGAIGERDVGAVDAQDFAGPIGEVAHRQGQADDGLARLDGADADAAEQIDCRAVLGIGGVDAGGGEGGRVVDRGDADGGGDVRCGAAGVRGAVADPGQCDHPVGISRIVAGVVVGDALDQVLHGRVVAVQAGESHCGGATGDADRVVAASADGAAGTVGECNAGAADGQAFSAARHIGDGQRQTGEVFSHIVGVGDDAGEQRSRCAAAFDETDAVARAGQGRGVADVVQDDVVEGPVEFLGAVEVVGTGGDLGPGDALE